MRLFRNFALIICLLVGINALGYAGLVVEAAPRDAVRGDLSMRVVKISPDKGVISAYEPVIIEVEVTNVSDEPVRVYVSEYLSERLEVRDNYRRLVGETSIPLNQYDRIYGIHLLVPGQKMRAAFIPSAVYVFNKPGNYSIRIMLLGNSIGVITKSSDIGPVLAEVFIPVSVRPFDKKRLERRCSELIGPRTLHPMELPPEFPWYQNMLTLWSVHHNAALPTLKFVAENWGECYPRLTATAIWQIGTPESTALLKKLASRKDNMGKAAHTVGKERPFYPINNYFTGWTNVTSPEPQKFASRRDLLFPDAYLRHDSATETTTKLVTALKSNDFTSAASIIINLESAFRTGKDVQSIPDWIRRIPIDSQKSLAVKLNNDILYKGDLIFARLVLANLYVSLNQPFDAARIISHIIVVAKGDDTILSRFEGMLSDPAMKPVAVALRRQFDEEAKFAQSASTLADRGEKDSALIKARILIRRWPKGMHALYSARSVFEKFEQWNELIAVEEALLSRSTNPRDDGTLSYIADLYAKAGRHSDAIQTFRKIISQTSSDSMRLEAFRDIIRVYIKQNDYDNVAKTVIESERIIDNSNMEIQVVHTCIFEGLNEQALTKSLETALGDTSGLPATRFLLGTLYTSSGRIDDARKAFSRAVDEANGDQFTLQWIANDCLGEGLMDLGSQIALKNYLNHPDKPYIALTAVNAHRTTGGIVEAIALAKLMISKWPNETVVMANLGDVLDGLQQWDDAIAARKNAVNSLEKVDEGFHDVMLLNLASTYWKAGHMADAVEEYKHLISTAKNKTVISSAKKSFREIKARVK